MGCRTITARSGSTTPHHQGAPVTALFPFKVGAWYGLPAQGVAVDDFADDNFDHGGHDFIGGCNLWPMSDRRPISAAGMSTFGMAPSWGSDWKKFIHEYADNSHSSYTRKRRCRTKTISSTSIRR